MKGTSKSLSSKKTDLSSSQKTHFLKQKFFSIPLLIIVFICLLFFNKTFFKGYVPMPFDLLISEYSPFKYESYMGYNPGAYPNKAQYFDVLRQFYPWKTFAIESLKGGNFPLWNPYNFSGAPLFANHQSSVLYPSIFFFLILPKDSAWTIFLLVQTPLLFVFTYLYARKIGLKKEGSILTGVAFSCSLFISSYFEYGIFGHTIFFLPALLYLCEELLESAERKKILLIPPSVALVFFAGHLQIAGFVLGFVIVYFLTRVIILRKFSRLFYFGTLLLLGFLISAIQTLPVFELFHYSARSNHEWVFFKTNLLFQLKNSILFLSPDFFGNPAVRNYLLTSAYPGNAVYIGIGTFVFFLYSIFWVRKKMVYMFGLFALLIFILVSANPISLLIYKIPLGQIRASTPTNAQFLLMFCLSILAGFGFESFLEKRNLKKIGLPLIFVSLVLGFYAFLFVGHMIDGYMRGLLFSGLILGMIVTAIFVIRLFFPKIQFVQYLLILFVIGDLFYFFQKFNPFVPGEITFSTPEVIAQVKSIQGINRSWGYSFANIDPNFQTYFNMYSPDGYDPLYPSWYGEFIQLSSNGVFPKHFTTKTRSDAGIAQGFGADDFLDNPYRKKILDFLGVKYILDRVDNGLDEKAFDPNIYTLLYDNKGWKVYENKKALPRFFLAENVNFYDDKNDFAREFFNPSFDSQRTVLVEKNSIDDSNFSSGSAILSFYNPSSIGIKTKTPGKSILFLSDTYYPGWNAYIDGQPTKLVRADYAFRGVVVPKGEHAVVFKYEPSSFKIGIYTSLAGIAGLMGYYFVVTRKKSEK